MQPCVEGEVGSDELLAAPRKVQGLDEAQKHPTSTPDHHILSVRPRLVLYLESTRTIATACGVALCFVRAHGTLLVCQASAASVVSCSPAAMATPTSAAASAGPSFSPSPIIATTCSRANRGSLDSEEGHRAAAAPHGLAWPLLFTTRASLRPEPPSRSGRGPGSSPDFTQSSAAKSSGRPTPCLSLSLSVSNERAPPWLSA